MTKRIKILAAVVFLIVFVVLSVNHYKDKESYLVELKKINYESIKSITVTGRSGELSLTSRRENIMECLQAINPHLIRGGDEVISIDIRFQDGGHLNNNLVVFHTSKTVVFGYGENSFVSPSLGISHKNSSFTGASKCIYSAIYE